MANTFCVSDTHFNHFKSIALCNRPFKDIEDMNYKIINNWNQRVKQKDTIYIIGDFLFNHPVYNWEYFNNILNGNKIFILGNHDYHNRIKTKITSMTIFYAKQEIFLVHNPEHYNKNIKINLCGHVHQHWKIKKRGDSILYNVGVDVHNFYPIMLNEVLEDIRKEKFL